MRFSLKPLIAALCLFAAGLVLAFAPPSKRGVVGLVVGVPAAIGAVAALRGYTADRSRQKRVTASGTDRPLRSLVADVDEFIRRAPELAAGFRARAASVLGAEADSLEALERFARRQAASIDLGSAEFLPWVAAYGEAVRASNRGRWSKAILFRRGEPIVVSGRFPYLRRAVLLEAYQVLEAAGDFHD